MNPLLSRYHKSLREINTIQRYGKVRKVVGLLIESIGPEVLTGDFCWIRGENGRLIRTEVVGVHENRVQLMPLGDVGGIGPGMPVIASGGPLKIHVGPQLLGRILDGLGDPIDDKGPLACEHETSILNTPPNPLTRERVHAPLTLGVRALDGLMTCGRGQRMGIFSGSGVGKSTLLGMIARYTNADVNVIALIGERGREVRDFIERDLGDEGLKRSVVVVATSDQPPLVRLRGAYTATAIAEYFREQGRDVLLMMDSVTRFARSQREVGLAVGEPPATRGYTPSVFTLLPRLLERAGTSERGSITGLYTVLVEGDDMNEPVADNARAILDGHVVLTRQLANSNHYPSIDILQSLSRVMVDIVPSDQMEFANKMREIVSAYREAEDLINIGAYVRGSNPKIDYALGMIDRVNQFLKQGIFEHSDMETTLQRMRGLFRGQ